MFFTMCVLYRVFFMAPFGVKRLAHKGVAQVLKYHLPRTAFVVYFVYIFFYSAVLHNFTVRICLVLIVAACLCTNGPNYNVVGRFFCTRFL